MKKRVGIIFGGKSAEHQVSLQSAKNILDALDRKKFDAVLIGIDQQGQWQTCCPEDFLEQADDPRQISLRPSHALNLPELVTASLSHQQATVFADIDVIFPIVHGTLGEDGALQGLLRVLGLPFVGSDVIGSAICMDKDVTKRLLRDAGIEVAPFVTLTPAQRASCNSEQIIAKLGLPLFVKPANQGSSVGVAQVKQAAELLPAIEQAFRYDRKVIIEQAIVGREIECAVLGNEQPQASRCGEIVLSDEFYSYDTKYINPLGAQVQVPAAIPSALEEQIRALAVQVFQLLVCCGMARVDLFLTADNRLVVNEVNTLPGFTNISMYPKLWIESGISYQDLISQLIELAIERHQH